jgi:hypothetical protein
MPFLILLGTHLLMADFYGAVKCGSGELSEI